METGPYRSLTDEAIAETYRLNGDAEAIGELFRRYKHLVFGICMKYLQDEDEAKDALMQVFEKLIPDLRKHEVGFFKGWLYRNAQNHCLMQLRKRKPERSGFEERVMENAAHQHLSSSDTESMKEREDMLNRLEQALHHLDEHQATCLKLFYLESRSYMEITASTGYSLNQVKSYIQNGKRNLKLKLEQHE
ncbi:MAG: RNA polymerase sigma factor [Bacteroidota bacterium]